MHFREIYDHFSSFLDPRGWCYSRFHRVPSKVPDRIVSEVAGSTIEQNTYYFERHGIRRIVITAIRVLVESATLEAATPAEVMEYLPGRTAG